MASFGFQGTPYSKEWSEAFKSGGTKGKARADGHETSYLKHNDIINKMNDPYLNVGFEREHFGGLTVIAAGTEGGKNMQFWENWHGPAGRQVLPDGSIVERTGATRNDYSGSHTSTNAMTNDAITAGNHNVTRSGNGDNKDYQAAGAPQHSGSSYHEDGNDSMMFNGGKHMRVSARSKYGGMCLGSHGFVCDAGGKGDQGYGWTVCNGDDHQIFHGGFGDNMYVCAVGKVKSASQPKGLYTLTVDKQGNMTIDTKGSVTIKSAKTHTIEAPTLKIQGPGGGACNIKHKGNYTQQGRHKDSLGLHTACGK